MQFLYILAILLMATSVKSQVRFENHIISLGFGGGTRDGDAFGEFDYADKLAVFQYIRRDQDRDETEARFYMQIGGSNPTGDEPLRLGIVLTQDRDDRPDWIKGKDPTPTKAYLSMMWRVAGGTVNLDQPMARQIDGEKCYARVRIEDIEWPFLNRGGTFALTSRVSYDFDPTVGLWADAGVVWRNRASSVEVLLMTREFSARFGKNVSW